MDRTSSFSFENNRKIYKALLMLGCLGVGIGYTLFAPIIFFAILICIMFCAHKEGWLLQNEKKFFSIKDSIDTQ